MNSDVKEAFKLSRLEILYIIIIAMLGVVMYFTYQIVDPIKGLVDLSVQQYERAIQQNDIIIDIQQAQGNISAENRTRMITAIDDTITLVPEVNKTLKKLENQTEIFINLTEQQLIPMVATLDLQRKAEIAHFNQTEVILNSIGTAANETQLQARQIQENQTR
jgi:hypothetical protein